MIHVDFTMTSRDLFRACLELSRVRLMIGGAIVFVFIIALVWFFWLIDQQLILLECSPLFIGLPLVGLGGQLLRIHAAYRKYFKNLPESLRRVQYHFQEGTDGYDVSCGDNFSHLVWRDLTKVIEKRDFFVFYCHGFERLIFKKGFHQPSDVSLFRRMLTDQLGTRVKLLSADTA
jgi:hypothetical protein